MDTASGTQQRPAEIACFLWNRISPAFIDWPLETHQETLILQGLLLFLQGPLSSWPVETHH